LTLTLPLRLNSFQPQGIHSLHNVIDNGMPHLRQEDVAGKVAGRIFALDPAGCVAVPWTNAVVASILGVYHTLK
jgi:hypothetical protein